MNDAQKTIEKYRQLEALSEGTTFIHDRHPLIKLITTVLYLTVVISFDQYQLIALLPFFIYIVAVKELAEMPFLILWNRLKLILPLLIGMGLFNPIMDSNQLVMGAFQISMGWISFLSLLIKGFLTVSAMILLIGTTGISGITYALSQLKLPGVFLMIFNLIYRYIEILLEEIVRMGIAYRLRSKNREGIKFSEWGSFAGHLLLRTLDRAENVYQAMSSRGFNGHFYFVKYRKLNLLDIVYLIGWVLFFLYFKRHMMSV